MATTKVTYTLDQHTLARLRQASEQLKKPKSQVVREAIDQYYERIGKLSEEERLRLLRLMDEMIARPPSRPQHEVDEEIRNIREARRTGGRKSPRDRT